MRALQSACRCGFSGQSTVSVKGSAAAKHIDIMERTLYDGLIFDVSFRGGETKGRRH